MTRRTRETITLSHDNLNRLIQKTFPTGTEPNVAYRHDLLGHLTAADFGTACPAGGGLAFA